MHTNSTLIPRRNRIFVCSIFLIRNVKRAFRLLDAAKFLLMLACSGIEIVAVEFLTFAFVVSHREWIVYKFQRFVDKMFPFFEDWMASALCRPISATMFSSHVSFWSPCCLCQHSATNRSAIITVHGTFSILRFAADRRIVKMCARAREDKKKHDSKQAKLHVIRCSEHAVCPFAFGPGEQT